MLVSRHHNCGPWIVLTQERALIRGQIETRALSAQYEDGKDWSMEVLSSQRFSPGQEC